MRKIFAFLILATVLAPTLADARQVRERDRRARSDFSYTVDAARMQLEAGAAAVKAAQLEASVAYMTAAGPAMAAAMESLRHLQVPDVSRELALAGYALQHVRPGLESAAYALENLGVGLARSARALPESFAPQDPADSLWRDGRSRLNRADWRGAIEVFRRIRTEQRFASSAYRPGSYYWEAFALSRTGSSDELRRAQELLAQMKQRYPADRQIADAEALAATIEGRLARGGDAEAAESLTRRASAANAQCPRGDDDDVRMVALNALLQMNSDNAVPILKEVMARRDECSAPLRRRAVFLLSQKRGNGVDQVLLDAVRNDPDPEVREMAVFWLSQVNTPEAVTALQDILRTSSDRKIQEKALFALAQNRSERVTEVLRAFIMRSDVASDLRRNAIFWMGQRPGENGEFLRNLYPQLQDQELKEQVLFALSQNRDPRNAEWLLEIALRDGESTETRKRALFHASQHRELPVARVAQLYDRTRDRELKESVLFALSQRVREPAAVDKLMEIGRNEPDAELRNRAIFWLGQSKDPRVAQYFLDIIKR